MFVDQVLTDGSRVPLLKTVGGMGPGGCSHGVGAMVFTAICLTFLPFILLGAVVGPMPWAVIAYSAMALRLMRRRRADRWQFSLAQLLGAPCRGSPRGRGAWRMSLLVVFEEYAKLPTSPPPSDCYVATAAARGHRRWVRAVGRPRPGRPGLPRQRSVARSESVRACLGPSRPGEPSLPAAGATTDSARLPRRCSFIRSWPTWLTQC